MAGWQYWVEHVDAGWTDASLPTAHLNQAGRSGWELAFVLPSPRRTPDDEYPALALIWKKSL